LAFYGGWALTAPTGKRELAPYDWCEVERELGLIDKNGNLKKSAVAYAEFTSFLKNFPYQELPQRKKNAICLLNPNKNNESLSRQHRYFNVESRNSFCG
jgi:hypothetical protein